MNINIIDMDGGNRCAFIADPHKARATAVLVRLLPQSAPRVVGAAAVSDVFDVTLGRSGGQLA